jgi:hypothetical protein
MAGHSTVELSIGLHHLHFDAHAEPLSYLNWSYISTTPFPSDYRLRIFPHDSVAVCNANCPHRPPAIDTSVASLLTTPSVLEVGPCGELGRPVSVPERYLHPAGAPTDIRAPSAITRSAAPSVSAPGVVLPVLDVPPAHALDQILVHTSVSEVGNHVGLRLPVSVPAWLSYFAGVPPDVRAPSAIAPDEDFPFDRGRNYISPYLRSTSSWRCGNRGVGVSSHVLPAARRTNLSVD